MDARADGTGRILITVCGRTHRGRVRGENQDRLLVADLAQGFGVVSLVGVAERRTTDERRGSDQRPAAEERRRDSSVGPLRFELTERGAVLLVADGMGGRAGGARASALAVASVGRSMADGASSDASAPDASAADAFVLRLRRALEDANRDIFEEASRDLSYAGMGTTATLAGIRGGVVYLAQVGDSRAYLVRGGSAARLTRDQSLLQDLIDSGVLSERDAQSAPGNKILQALGVRPSVEPVLTYQELRRGDVLLLCSDGLSKVVRDEEILEAARQASDCVALCDRLIGLANDRGGPDNITVVVARLDGDGLAAADRADPVGRRAYPLPEG
jgi:protein phosphatase